MSRGWRISVGLILVVASLAGAATYSENFASDPRARGWKTFGDTNLFRWNAANQNLAVTWDSSRTNSYFHWPLGTILSTGDNFSIAFDLRLSDIAIGTSSNKPYTFQLALGCLNYRSATNANYFRGTGQSAPSGVRNTVEFDYFPDSGYGATFAPTMIASNPIVAFSDNHPLTLTTNDLFHIAMSYTASNLTLKTVVTRNGLPFGKPPLNALDDLVLTATPSFKDFRADSLAVINWNDAVQAGSTQYWGSILSHGTVDNFVVTVPDPPVSQFTGTKSNATWRATFGTKVNWFYALERSADFATWSVTSPTNSGTGGTLLLQDTNASGSAFYRVKAMKP